jgi:putative MATE family efflux protein
MALIANASGRKDRGEANLIFNQSLLLAGVCAAATLAGGYAFSGAYMGTFGADAETTAAGVRYLAWFLPGLALQFALVATGAALRGTGIAKPTMVVQILTVALNALLAPVLIAGWLTGRPLGVAGAGLASSLSIGVGVALMVLYFLRLEKYVQFDAARLRPQVPVWRRILRIGLPPGGEFALIFVYMAVIYWIIRDFGAAAQAGFGVGSRVMQAIFLPAMAIAFATAPVAGQNVGAGLGDRVRETLRSAALIGSVLMLALTLTCQWRPDWFIRFFTGEEAVVAVGSEFLRIISWNFVATGLIFTASGVFQALGNTVPALLASATRIATFVVPGLWLAGRPGFTLRQLWILSVSTVALQAIVSLWMLMGELRKRLRPAAAPEPMAEPAPAGD